MIGIPNPPPHSPAPLAKYSLKLHNFASTLNFQPIHIIALKLDLHKSTAEVLARYDLLWMSLLVIKIAWTTEQRGRYF